MNEYCIHVRGWSSSIMVGVLQLASLCTSDGRMVHQGWVSLPSLQPFLGWHPHSLLHAAATVQLSTHFFFLWPSLQLTFIDCQVIQFQDVSGNRSVMKGVPLFLIQMQFLLWARFLLDGRSVDRRELLPAVRCGFILSPSRTGRTSWSCWEGVSS